MTIENKIKGAIYGALLGDATGVSFEFKPALKIPPLDQIDIIPPSSPFFQKTYLRVPPGTWSDDGSLILCLLDALVSTTTRSWQRTFINNMQEWREHGLYAVDGKKFDIGNQTAHALLELDTSFEYLTRPPDDVSYNGNGSLMRALPVALVACPPDRSGLEYLNWLDEMSIAQSTPTHNNPVSLVCCVFYNRVACQLLHSPMMSIDEAWDNVISYMNTKLQYTMPNVSQAIRTVLNFEHKEPTGSGYVVDTLWSAYYALSMGSNFKETIQHAIAYGNDTDTTACVAGGLAGIIYGYDALPQDWLGHLRGKEIVDPLIEKLFTQRKSI